MLTSSDYVMRQYLIFFLTMECWCDEPLWRSQLKNSLKVILGHWQQGHFEKNHSQLWKNVLNCFSKRNNAITSKLCSWLFIYHLNVTAKFHFLNKKTELSRRRRSKEIMFSPPKWLKNWTSDFKKVLMLVNYTFS